MHDTTLCATSHNQRMVAYKVFQFSIRYTLTSEISVVIYLVKTNGYHGLYTP